MARAGRQTRSDRRRAGSARARRGLVPAAVLVTAGLITASAGPALAADGAGDPLGGLKEGVHKTVDTVHKVTSALPESGRSAAPTGKASTASRASTPSRKPGSPSSRSESGSNDVADPAPPDHGAADVLTSKAAGQDLVTVGGSRSTVEDDDTTRSDSTLLAIGGQEVAGSHADSRGDGSDHFAPFAPGTTQVCDQSGGQFCADVLYADSSAGEDDDSSNSASDAGIASVCAGGTDTNGTCDAPVQAGVGDSSAAAHRDRRTGETTASSDASLANVCLNAPAGGLPAAPGGLPELPDLPSIPLPGGADVSCALGLALLSSEGQADSGGSHPSASRKSSVATIDAGGNTQTVSDPEAAELPPGCPVGSSALCTYYNQGETYVGPGSVAGHAQEAVKARLLPGLVSGADLLDLVGARSETLVHNDGGEPVVAGEQATRQHHAANRAPVATEVEASASAPAAAPAGGLPNTGGPSAGLLAVGLLAFGAGAVLVAASRFVRYGVAC